MPVSKELLKGNSELLILSALADQPMHGYALSQRLNAIMPGMFKFGVGMLYPLLHRLELRGYITGRWETRDGEKRKKIYTITLSGKKQLARATHEWQMFSHAMNTIVTS